MSMSNREAKLERLWNYIPTNEKYIVERYLENRKRYAVDLKELSDDARAYIALYLER